MPKMCMHVDKVNIYITPKKLVCPYGMQIAYKTDNDTVRNIYLFAESGEVSKRRNLIQFNCMFQDLVLVILISADCTPCRSAHPTSILSFSKLQLCFRKLFFTF